MLPHSLQRDFNAHLSTSDVNGTVEEVKIRKLPIDAIIHDMKRFESVIQRIVYGNYPLQSAALER